MEEFREILKDLIMETGMSLRQLEKESGVSAMQFSRYLRGAIPTIEVVLRIAKYFNCSVDCLFGLDSEKNTKKYTTYDFKIEGFVDRYCKLLKKNNITNYKFAQTSMFDESIIRHWRAGTTPRLDIVFVIAKDLGGSMDELIGRY